MTDRPNMFGRTLQEADIWLNEIRDELNLPEKGQNYAALRAVLHELRDRLPVQETAHLAAQLPTLIRGVYYESWRPNETPKKERHREEFIEGVREKLFGHDEIDPEVAIKSVFSVLQKHVTAGEIQDVVGMLPKDLQQMWPEHRA